jgi:hypothetical protein
MRILAIGGFPGSRVFRIRKSFEAPQSRFPRLSRRFRFLNAVYPSSGSFARSQTRWRRLQIHLFRLKFVFGSFKSVFAISKPFSASEIRFPGFPPLLSR